jgi:hypothetical protein
MHFGSCYRKCFLPGNTFARLANAAFDRSPGRNTLVGNCVGGVIAEPCRQAVGLPVVEPQRSCPVLGLLCQDSLINQILNAESRLRSVKLLLCYGDLFIQFPMK